MILLSSLSLVLMSSLAEVDSSSMRKVNLASPSVVGHPGEAPAGCELHQVGVRWGSWLRLQRHAFPGVVVLRLEIEREI